MENLEQFIKDNHDNFNQDEPNAHHHERFKRKLESNQAKPKTFALKIAAGFFFIIIAAWFLQFFMVKQSAPHQNVAIKELSLKDISPELAEVETYYNSALEIKMQDFYGQKNSNNFDPELYQQIDILDKEYQKLKLDLAENQGNKMIIMAMIQNLKLRLDAVEQLLLQTKNLNQSNYENDKA